MKKNSKDLIKFYLLRQKKLAFLLGILNTYCDLTSKGVRNNSLLAPYWTTDKHVQHFPMIKEITQAYSLQIFPHPDLIDKENNKYWVYYIYTKGSKKKVKELISLFKMVHENKKKKSLHRKIGKLLGHSQGAIVKKYK